MKKKYVDFEFEHNRAKLEMDCYDSFPPRVRRALDELGWNAVEALELVQKRNLSEEALLTILRKATIARSLAYQRDMEEGFIKNERAQRKRNRNR